MTAARAEHRPRAFACGSAPRYRIHYFSRLYLFAFVLGSLGVRRPREKSRGFFPVWAGNSRARR